MLRTIIGVVGSLLGALLMWWTPDPDTVTTTLEAAIFLCFIILTGRAIRDLRRYTKPGARMLREAEEELREHRREQNAHFERKARASRFMSRPRLHLPKRRNDREYVEFGIGIKPTWHTRAMAVNVWLANHRLLPRRLVICVGERLGYPYAGVDPGTSY